MQVSGFDEKLECSEDRDLARRVEKIGFKIVYEPEADWWHSAPRSLVIYLKRSFWNGKEKVPYCFKYKEFPYKQLLFLFAVIIALTFAVIGLVSFMVLLVVTLSAFTIKLAYTIKIGFRSVSKRWCLILIPFLSFIRAVAFLIGFIYGLITYKQKPHGGY